MGLGTFLKSILNTDKWGDEIIAAQVQCYQATKAEYPDWEPHKILANMYLMRMASLGHDVKTEALQLKAYVDTNQYACLPHPSNARALGLWFIYKERPDILEKHPKFSEEYGRLMLPIFQAMEDGSFPNLYRRFNPKAAQDMDEMKPEQGQDPF